MLFRALTTLVLTGWISTAAANPFATRYCLELAPDDRATECHQVAPGETWATLYPEPYQRSLAMHDNRQNIALRPGQWLRRLPEGATRLDLAPFLERINPPGEPLFVFDPAKLAWAAYDAAGTLTMWGAAMGGASWCSDVGRPCLTPVARFSVMSIAGEGRRSNKYPVGCVGEECALMPFFSRLTSSGIGIHAGTLYGEHVSHGCINLFFEDMEWLVNGDAFTAPFLAVGTTVRVLPYEE